MAELIDLAARRKTPAPDTDEDHDEQADLAIKAMALVSDLPVEDLRAVISLARALQERGRASGE